MKRWFKIEDGVKKAVIYIYGAIGGWEDKAKKSVKTAESFIEAFDKVTADEIDIHINSGGGNVFDGIAIYSHIVSSEKTVNTYVDALAASIASIIALAGQKVYMARNAQLMIHNATAVAIGTASDMRKTAGILESIEDQLIDIYNQKTGIAKDELRQMMDAETWLNAQASKEKGFIDEITSALKIAASLDLSQFEFKHIPPELKESEAQNYKEGEPKMNELLQLLQVSSETEAISKIKGIRQKRDEFEDENKTLKDKLTNLTNEKKTLEEKLSEFKEKEIENIVDKAITDGKLLPSQKDFALKMAKNDRKMFTEYLENQSISKLIEEMKINSDNHDSSDSDYGNAFIPGGGK